MNEYIKEFGKVILACLAFIGIVLIPSLLSLVVFYLVNPSLAVLNSCNDYSLDLISFFYGALISSFIGFFWYIFLTKTQKTKMDVD